MKSIVILFTIIFTIASKCYGVPPSPNDRLWDEITSAKNVMANIAAQLEKFNSLYLMKLEQRMTSIASMLSNIDSNVKNLQERAHVWDTFQLHVSAWNEQINTLDKKVDIISKGQEKMVVLDGKMNSISNIEYRTERILGKIDDNISHLQTIIKIVENQNHDPLLGEFTTRGVLSTLKNIERKLDKLQMQHSSSQSMLVKQLNDNKRTSDNPDGQQKNKLMIKCNTPPIVEELLSDVASKVDVMFDKFTGADEQSDESSGDDTNVDLSPETKSDPDLKLIKGLLKRLNQPCKRTVKVLENLESSIKGIDNITLSILEEERLIHTDLLTFCRANNKNDPLAEVIDKIDYLRKHFDNKLSLQQETISSHFAEQREHIFGIVETEVSKVCTRSQMPVEPIFPKNNQPKYEEKGSTDKVTNTDKNITYYDDAITKYTDKFNCEDLTAIDSSGVYMLGESEYKNSAGRSYNIRFCEITNEGIWTVIQRRGVNPEIQKFNNSWIQYKDGFGSLNKDFWFGNDFINNLSEEKNLLLRVELEDFEGNSAWAEYTTFKVDKEEDNYKLNIEGYRGNASNSFSSHDNNSFSTFDRTNDQAPACCPCASSYGGGWWFNSCFEANLNGVYYRNPFSNDYFRGLIWEHWLGNYSLRKTKMMVRQKSDSDAEFGSEPEITAGWNETDIPEDP